ncbi:glycosyl hydrolase family 28 protein [Plebeiibacterium sediminum]|uniref:Glycosyl hydrolase family 28 protein n=1 Tax=Plebeiibacterium sediminum TaxID=2992112 RepID=A0AAE3M5Q8_9BACT|nr:glycosyl hydrolase family 28 protein [Plebeiobacterium sediminum]MCW3787664.1 glycosyl hydrolase family 28 protein [Plebeiobacterium sediminum]
MQNIKTSLLIIILTILSSSAFSEKNLKIYPAPEGAIINHDFNIKVREVNGKWQEIPCYLIKVDEVRGSKHQVENASMSYFDFSGDVEVMVTFNNQPVDSARIRPLSYHIQHQIKGQSVYFKLNQPANLSVEVNGDIFHNLHLFANPMLEEVPSKKDPDVIWFGPGIHEFDEGKFIVPSNKTVYVDGSAILRGQLLIHDAHDVKIIGRGMVEYSVKMGVHISNSKNVLVEGIFCTQCATGGSEHVTIRNVKSISYYGWGDGMNVFASNDVLYDRVFCRNSDDCTTVYATRKGFTGGCNNITMQNSTLWADVAHPIMIGIHGNSENPDTIQNLKYINIDILDHKEMQIDYQGCLTINAGDNNLIKDVLFEDIRIENFREGQLVNLRIFYNTKYCTAPGMGIENITFRNVEYNGDNANLSIIAGYNEERKVKNIIFENLRINGVCIHDKMEGKPAWYKTSDMAHFFVGEHVEGIEFRK